MPNQDIPVSSYCSLSGPHTDAVCDWCGQDIIIDQRHKAEITLCSRDCVSSLLEHLGRGIDREEAKSAQAAQTMSEWQQWKADSGFDPALSYPPAMWQRAWQAYDTGLAPHIAYFDLDAWNADKPDAGS